MKAVFRPSTANGTVKAPSSKSMAHRLLVCAALNAPGSPGIYDERDATYRIGNNVISNLELSDDIRATLNCIKTLSVLSESDIPIFNCGGSGSTLRFFIPVSLLTGRHVIFKGSGRLMERPLGIYEDICREQGLLFKKEQDGLHIKGKLSSGEYVIPGDVSSQFISGLLFALPLLEGDSIIKLIPPVESRPYIDMTVRVLSLFGVHASFTDENTISVPGGQKYISLSIAVEGDYSNASYIEAFDLAGGNVSVTGLDPDSLQGDKIYREYFKMLETPGSVIDISDCPDLGPVLMTAAALKCGAVFTGTKRLAFKESDRCAALKEEFFKFGKEIIINYDSVTVPAGELHCPDEDLSGHNDHRIVMALSLPASVFGGTIDGAEAVNKSFPGFFETLRSLGIDVTEEQ